jgi:hypothetical protein
MRGKKLIPQKRIPVVARPPQIEKYFPALLNAGQQKDPERAPRKR